jgi:hypothetical protein
MNKKVKTVKGNGKGMLTPAGSGAALNQKSQIKKHMAVTAPTLSEFLSEAEAELESLFA